MRKGRKKRRKTAEKLPKNYHLDSIGTKKTVALKAPKKPQGYAFFIDAENQALERKRKRVEQSNAKRQADGQSINWSAFGGLRKKLEGSGLRATFMNVKRKTYKRWSKK